MTAIEGEPPGEALPVWLVRAGRHGEDEATALEEGLAIIGFQKIGDVSELSDSEAIAAHLREIYPEWGKAKLSNHAGQLAAFALRIREGDIVALPLKIQAGQIALGRVKGPYAYREVAGTMRHTRSVEWVRPDVPRSQFRQDLLYSLGAFLTVCRIQRNDAERRIASILGGKTDPGPSQLSPGSETGAEIGEDGESVDAIDISQMAHDQILAHIQSRFAGHALAQLIDAVLRAEGYITRLSPPGPDGGVDILAGRGSLGFDAPRLCVQVKSSNSPAEVTIFRALQGTMQSFGADQGLLVCWGGFSKPLLQEARQSFFSVRLWDASDIVEAMYRVYDRLPEEIQTELPLKRVWTLVLEDVPA